MSLVRFMWGNRLQFRRSPSKPKLGDGKDMPDNKECAGLGISISENKDSGMVFREPHFGELGAMYLRKSRADEEKEKRGKYQTLVKHEAELRELSEKMKLPIDDVFKEMVSGESIEARSEFRKLMAGVQERKYAYVFCHAVDRLGRGDMMEYGWVLSTFQITGTKIVTPYKTYDPLNSMDLQQLQFQMLFANFEYETIKGRMISGRRASVKEGQYIPGTPPMGYDKTVVDGKRTLKKNDMAPVILEIFERIAAGEAKYSVARDLTKRGVRTPNGNCLTPNNIIRIVTGLTYKGYVCYATKKTVVDGRDGMNKKKRRVKGDDPIIVKGLHEAIVSEELWNAANEAIAPDPSLRKSQELANPLARTIVCAKCGRSLTHTRTYRNGKIVGTYYKHQANKECNCKNIPVKVVIDALVDKLAETAGDYQLRIAQGEKESGDRKRRLESIEKSIKRIEKRKDKLIDLYAAGAISMEDFRRRNTAAETELASLKEELEAVQSRMPKPYKRIAMSLRRAVKLLASEEIPAQVRNDALRQVVERIDYDREGNNVYLDVFIRE